MLPCQPVQERGEGVEGEVQHCACVVWALQLAGLGANNPSERAAGMQLLPVTCRLIEEDVTKSQTRRIPQVGWDLRKSSVPTSCSKKGHGEVFKMFLPLKSRASSSCFWISPARNNLAERLEQIFEVVYHSLQMTQQICRLTCPHFSPYLLHF